MAVYFTNAKTGERYEVIREEHPLGITADTLRYLAYFEETGEPFADWPTILATLPPVVHERTRLVCGSYSLDES